MNTAEVAIGEVQGNRGFQVRQLLAERIREPRKSPHRHTHGEVLPNAGNGWILLAEDAEKDAAKARERVEKLSQAARIFRRNAESGMPFPQSAIHTETQQHCV